MTTLPEAEATVRRILDDLAAGRTTCAAWNEDFEERMARDAAKVDTTQLRTWSERVRLP